MQVFNLVGAGHFLELRRWCRQFTSGLSAELRPHFAHWPGMAARVALGLGIMNEAITGNTLPECFVAAAWEFARQYAPIQAALLEKFHTGDSKAVETERQVQRLLQKVRAKGPLSLRSLVRSYDRQDYGLIEERLRQAVERGLVKQRGPLFFAASVSDSGVSEPHILNFP